MSKQRVMEDLDALLADLQSTASAPKSMTYQAERDYDNKHGVPLTGTTAGVFNTMSYNSSQNYEFVSDADGQPLYEPQSVQTLPNTSSVVNKQMDIASGHPRGVPRQQQMLPGGAVNSSPSPRQVSTLSSNLSELDSLLQELSSAQFSIEVDRRNAGSVVSPPGGGNFNANKERSVDSLLSDLDNTPPLTKPASTATRDLDDLMASLSCMTSADCSAKTPTYAIPDKARAQAGDDASFSTGVVHGARLAAASGPSAATILPVTGVRQMVVSTEMQNVNLNEMMEALDKNMTKQGVTTVPKGHCAACSKPIVGQVITALARLWHPEHFMCVHCKEPIGTRNFFERDSQPYCERDYHLLFSPYCGFCKGPILDKCVTALDRTWHPEHFCCTFCGQQLTDEEGFHERDGKVYCRKDYYEQFAPRCGGCSHPIIDNFITALNNHWHPKCFVCFECRVPFGAGNFFDHEGFPYCETHFHAKRGSLCATCHKPITGRCITAMYKKFHPEHFVCTFCQKQLNKGTFKEENDKPYCHPCFVRLYS